MSNKPLHRGFKKIDPENLEKVKEYNEKIKDIPEEKIAYVDETGINSYLYHEYGHAPCGQKVYDKVSEKKFQRTNIIAAQLGKEIIAPMQYSSKMRTCIHKKSDIIKDMKQEYKANHYESDLTDGQWEKICRELVKETRIQNGRNPEPSYAMIDSQSVKTTYNSEKHGYDGGKNEGKKKDIS